MDGTAADLFSVSRTRAFMSVQLPYQEYAGRAAHGVRDRPIVERLTALCSPKARYNIGDARELNKELVATSPRYSPLASGRGSSGGLTLLWGNGTKRGVAGCARAVRAENIAPEPDQAAIAGNSDR